MARPNVRRVQICMTSFRYHKRVSSRQHAATGGEEKLRNGKSGVRGESAEEQKRREADHAAINGGPQSAGYLLEMLRSSLPQPAARALWSASNLP